MARCIYISVIIHCCDRVCFIWEESNLCVYYKMRVAFKKTEGTIKNRQSRDTGKFGHTKDRTKTKNNKQMIENKINKQKQKTNKQTKKKKKKDQDQNPPKKNQQHRKLKSWTIQTPPKPRGGPRWYNWKLNNTIASLCIMIWRFYVQWYIDWYLYEILNNLINTVISVNVCALITAFFYNIDKSSS